LKESRIQQFNNQTSMNNIPMTDKQTLLLWKDIWAYLSSKT